MALMKQKKFDFTCDPFGRAFVENHDKTISEQVAYGLLEASKYRTITFADNCMLPTISAMPENGASFYTASTGIGVDCAMYDRLAQANPEHKDDILAIKEYMYKASTGYRSSGQCLTGYEQRLISAKAFWAGSWIGHANPDYDRVLHLGTDGIRALIEECRAKNPGKDWFYDAAKITMDAVDVIGDRIVEMAKENAAVEADAVKKAEWERIADCFTKIPRKPAYDMYSAVQMFWLFFTFDSIDSPGRMDQCFIDYYDKDKHEEAEEMITRMLEAIHNVRAWNLCISGSDENWNDETNEISYIILKKVTELKYQTPNLTMRVHRNTPEKLWKMAAECLATGIGLPAIYNDEVVCPALEAIGIPPCDSHDYCMNGCNQIDIMGKSHMGLEDGEINLGKVLELTLHNGVDFCVDPPEIIARRFGNPCDCKTFDEFLALFYKMLDHITDLTVTVANRFQEAYAAFAPNPLRSCTIQGCLEKGLDYKNGGPLYGHGQILLEGIADTADSMWAIKTLVYDQKKYTMEELIKALQDNFEGHETLHRDFASCDKFGNDIEECDELCAEIVDHVFRYLKTKKTFRGGVYTGGCSPFNRAADYGIHVGALPNGKRRGEANYADSIAATPGCDTNGPTAAIKSMMHYRQKEAGSGFVAQMKFSRSVFCTEEGMNAFISLAKTYFENGGQQLSINVVDRATLLAAKAEPEKYKNLIVRVGGYSDYFYNLSDELKQNVIDRSEFAL
jgi:pyruvate-formate lyase